MITTFCAQEYLLVQFGFVISGINRLVEEGIFTAGYPLHPVSWISIFEFSARVYKIFNITLHGILFLFWFKPSPPRTHSWPSPWLKETQVPRISRSFHHSQASQSLDRLPAHDWQIPATQSWVSILATHQLIESVDGNIHCGVHWTVAKLHSAKLVAVDFLLNCHLTISFLVRLIKFGFWNLSPTLEFPWPPISLLHPPIKIWVDSVDIKLFPGAVHLARDMQ